MGFYLNKKPLVNIVCKEDIIASSLKNMSSPRFIEPLTNLRVKAGKTATMDCVVTGNPGPAIDWYFNGKNIRDEGRFKYLFERNEVVGLEIRLVTPLDAGGYKVVATNASGTAESKATLDVDN